MRLDRLVTPWAARHPEQIAVESGDEVLTYAELDALANRFARTLVRHGVRPGDRVGVHLPRSGRGVAAMLGALRAGAVYVPLDPMSPPARVELIACDAGLRHVVISPALLARWLAAGVRGPVECFLLAAHGPAPELPAPARVVAWSDLTGASGAPLPSDDTNPDALAYLLYTSGSTGVPKGVMLSHRNALSFVDWAAAQIELSPEDRVASVAPFHFDLSVFDLWGSLSRGASVVIVDETTMIFGRRMLDRILEGRISVWYSVPSAWMMMLDQGGLEARGAGCLRAVLFAGEVFPIKHLRRAMLAVPYARFFNLFGPTETNVCLAYELVEPPAADASAIPIGYPSCGDCVSILDDAGHPVTDGVIGELFVDGPTVMLGYWNGGACAAPRRPYATGDLVSREPDGVFMYHGRRDHLVKIHGCRVELGEIEAVLNTHPAVQEVVAFARGQQLVTVLVPADPGLSVQDVRQHCGARLPRYMVPTDVRLVKRLPRTSSGKIDRLRTQAAVLGGDMAELCPLVGEGGRAAAAARGLRRE